MPLAELAERFPAQPQPNRMVQPTIPFNPNMWLNFKPPVLSEIGTLDKIADAIRHNVAGKSVGYAITITGPTGKIKSVAGGEARRTPDGSPRAMSPTDRITVASVSKMITAAAIMRSLTDKGISVDDYAYKYLPQDWTFSYMFKSIKISQIMQHMAGIRDENCGLTIAALKKCVALGPGSATNEIFYYANSDYALMRVMLVQLNGGGATTDAEFGTRYVALTNQLVWNSIGQARECKTDSIHPALSYKSTKDNGTVEGKSPYYAPNYDFSSVQLGQDWGDMTNVCGSQGWNLDSVELSLFIHSLMRTEKILPKAVVQQMRAKQLGMYWYYWDNKLGSFSHGGYHPAGYNMGEINTYIISYDNGYSIGAIFNSRYNGNYSQDLTNGVLAGTQ